MNAPGTGLSLQRLGRYHLSDCLGGGPTGEVFRAKVYGVAGIDREFAVKRFHESLMANPGAADAIAMAARTYGALEHPRVARLHEFGTAEGHTFTATEYVPGLDLTQLIDQGKLSLGTAAALIVQIGRALGYAHGQGLTHLGLAPTNVICTERGKIKVTDFGLLPVRLSSNPAGDESLRRRLCYLSPEQLEGKATSPATDVYQLGTLAFELMVGRKPYEGRNNEELAKQMLGDVVPTSGLPQTYDKFLRRALARSPFERFPDAGAMADALEAARRSSPAPGRAADAGVAVTSRMKLLQERHDDQASGALSFPIPAPPKSSKEEVLESVATPPPIPSKHKFSSAPGGGHVRTTKDLFGKIPSILSIPPIPSSTENVPYTNEHEAETRVGVYKEDLTGGGDASPEEALTKVHPELLDGEMRTEADLELGPAGTDPSVAPQDLLGGVDSAYLPPDEAPTTVRTEHRAETQEDEDTVVRGAGSNETPMFTVSDDELESESPRRDLKSASEPSASPVATSALKPSSQAASRNSELRRPHNTPQNDLSELIVLDPGGPESVPMPHLPSKESGIGSRAHRMPPELQALTGNSSERKGGASKLVPAILVGALAAAGAFFGYQYLADTTETSGRSATHAVLDSGVVIPSVAHGDVTKPLIAVADASPPVVTAPSYDAAGEAIAPVASEPLDGLLRIESKPAGAKVYLDGTMVGTAPVELDASTDHHRLALLLAGYDLYTSEIEGSGQLKIEMTEVTPPGGPGGIKIRCRHKNRYYVYVDGNPVGELCPTERIGVSKGAHVVEIYDPLTDSRKAFNVNVVDTRLSVRLKVD